MDSAWPSSSFEASASSESPALSQWGFMLGSNPPKKSVVVSLVPVIVLLVWYFISYQISPLKKYPGPWLAGLLLFLSSMSWFILIPFPYIFS